MPSLSPFRDPEGYPVLCHLDGVRRQPDVGNRAFLGTIDMEHVVQRVQVTVQVGVPLCALRNGKGHTPLLDLEAVLGRQTQVRSDVLFGIVDMKHEIGICESVVVEFGVPLLELIYQKGYQVFLHLEVARCRQTDVGKGALLGIIDMEHPVV